MLRIPPGKFRVGCLTIGQGKGFHPRVAESTGKSIMKRGPEQILKIIEANREKIKGFGVRRLGLFGSGARSEATETSDLDFLVDMEPKTFDSYMDLKEFMEQLFGCKVDLVMKDALKPRLREPILKETIYAQGL
ncbi:MAG: nucleotidyltransferase family protein [Desulfobaccales bacterium]